MTQSDFSTRLRDGDTSAWLSLFSAARHVDGMTAFLARPDMPRHRDALRDGLRRYRRRAHDAVRLAAPDETTWVPDALAAAKHLEALLLEDDASPPG